jgi:hypothetical protein
VDLVTVIPVLNRPSRVLPLFVSWQASRAPGRLVFVVEVDDLDERIALEAVRSFHGVDVVSVVDAHSWPEKVCVAADVYKDAEWLLFGADDVEFTPGWWQATKELRDTKSVGVIGTNDMSNPRVLAGEHTTHPLMRRAYIDRWGTVDEPGVPVHAGYSHWYVDDELVWTAKMRQAWAFCEGARVVHHHPYFDESVPWDDTYAAGEQNAAQDRKLFCERAPMFGVECG